MGIFDGWNYHFRARPAVNAQASARRATFEQFQTLPANMVQGSGTLTAPNGIPGKYFSVTQPPQVYANHVAVVASLFAGGVRAGGLYGQPLADNPHSSNGF